MLFFKGNKMTPRVIDFNSLLVDENSFNSRIGGKLNRDIEIIKKLEDLEQRVRAISPLPAKFELNRAQGTYFTEFTYTDLFNDCIYISPMSPEASCRITVNANNYKDAFLDNDVIFSNAKDKYVNLQPSVKTHENIVLLCGSNLLWKMVREERLREISFSNDDLLVKPHPLTKKEDIIKLNRIFGEGRVVDESTSGVQLLEHATRVYSLSTSSLFLRAKLEGKELVELSSHLTEAAGSYYPLVKFADGLSHMHGVFKLGVNDTDDHLKEYFEAAMILRKSLKPICPPIVYNEEKK